jgi:hypothetical protein
VPLRQSGAIFQSTSLKISTSIAAVAVTLWAACAQAQTFDPSMSCTDYLKLDKAMADQMAGMSVSTGDAAADKEAADMDKKIRDYCGKNPRESAMTAIQKAMGL